MFEYQGFATLGVNLNRQKYGPLDVSNVFTSQADLNYYISKGAKKEGVAQYWLDTVPYPYAGQYVALVDNATRTVQPYILVEKEDGTFEAAEISGTDTNTTYTLESTEDREKVTLTFTPSDGAAVTTITIPKTDLADYLTTADKSALEGEISKKANAADVYTKTEADIKISEAVAAADRLKRKIVENKTDIAVNAADALQYIYMVPSGLIGDDNKYYEYIVIEETTTTGEGEGTTTSTTRKLEKVGSWEVDLSEYAKTADVNKTLGDYIKTADADDKYETKENAANYETIEHANATFATIADAATKTELANTKTALEKSIGKKVDAVEGSRLITQTEVDKLAAIAENAEVNFIKAVEGTEFSVTSDTSKLGLVAVPQSKVSGLTKKTWADNGSGELIGSAEAANLADILVDATDSQSGFITPVQVQKLNALVIGDGDNVEISGKVSAENVTGLAQFITDSDALKTVNSNISALDTRVGSLENLVNNETSGLAALNTKVGNLETELNKYVLKTDYDSKIAKIEESTVWGNIVNE